MTELTEVQIDRLTENIVAHMGASRKFARQVAEIYAKTFSADGYRTWFGEDSDALSPPGETDDGDMQGKEQGLPG